MNRTTLADLESAVRRLKNISGSEDFALEKAYGQYKLTNANESHTYVPRSPLPQLVEKIHAFADGIDWANQCLSGTLPARDSRGGDSRV